MQNSPASPTLAAWVVCEGASRWARAPTPGPSRCPRPRSPRRTAPRPHASRPRARRCHRLLLGEPQDAHLCRATDRLRGKIGRSGSCWSACSG